MNLQFKPIEIDNISEMLPFYNMRKNKTCDSVFLESFIWKEFYNVRYAIWENKALLWLMEYNGRCFSAMPLCREEDLPGAFQAIETYFNEELGYPLVMNLADEYAVEYLKLPETKYVVKEEKDAGDYLYLGESMRTLSGKKLHKKKNRVNAFMREYEGRYEYRALCCSDSHYVWEFLDKWREQKGEEVEEHLDYEVRGIHDILKNCSCFNIKMGGVFIDGQLEAFTIGSYNPVENMAVIHIEKANPEINGLYQYINRQFLIEEFPDVEWVNREDDLGIEGLRKAKMSYYPADFARKYLIEQIVDGRRGYQWAEDIGTTASGEELRYLGEDEKNEVRELWHSCFPEDSEEFTDYYFTEKVKDNRILIDQFNGSPAAMAHWNPYKMQVNGRNYQSGYIVGVATREDRRHQGHMSRILKKMLTDMQNEKNPFTFLMPADEAIYRPFQFVTVYHQKNIELKKELESRIQSVVCKNTKEDCEKAAAWMQKRLEETYEMFCVRDEKYVSRLIKELESESGALEFLYEINSGLSREKNSVLDCTEAEERESERRFIGLRAFWGLKEKEQRLLYIEEKETERQKEAQTAKIMIRITSLKECLEMFTLKNGENPAELYLEITDPLLEENSGIYHWKLTEEKSEAVKIDSVQKPEADICMNIEELETWLFGVKKSEEIRTDLNAGLLKKLSAVKCIERIFIDEIV